MIEINIWYIIGTLVAGFFLAGIRVIRPFEKGLHERFGKFIGEREQGFRWIIPVIDRMVKVDITENMVDVQPQKIITKDKLNADVDAMVYFKVNEPPKAIYKAENYRRQIVNLAKTTLRNIIGTMSLADANEGRGKINQQLEEELDKHTKSWGIEIVRVELQRIEPPEKVQAAMNEVVEAENKKTSAVNFANATETEADGKKRGEIKIAEGRRQGMILEAEAKRQSQILEAEGEANAIKKVADAKAEEIRLVNQSIQKNFKAEAQDYKKLETAERALQSSTKYVIDPNSQITNVMTDMAGVTPIQLKKK